MAAPRDADIGGVARAKRKKVVRRKAPPMPVPDMEAALRIPSQPLPKPRRRTAVERSVVYKPPTPTAPPAPHGGHVPIILQKEAPLDVAFAPKPGSTRDRQIKAYNQQTEKQRRADARAERTARNARKVAVRKLPPAARQVVGADKLQTFIETGQMPGSVSDTVGGIASGIGHAIVGGPSGIDLVQRGAKAAGDSLESRLSNLINERRRGPTGVAQTVADVGHVGEAVGVGASDVALGPNLTRAMAGESYDPKWALAEMALLAVPIKGLPTPLTTILRMSVGATKLARAERAGMTVAEVLTRPISEVRAASRASLIAKAADPAITGPIPSSRIAGALAGKGDGRIARIIRNDVRATRKFTVGDATVETAADLSRSGKAVRAVMDKVRDSRLVPLRSNETLFARQVGKQAVQHLNRAAGLEKALSSALPRGALHNVDWPGIYAVRTVAKGVPIADAIATTERAVADSVARGDWLGEQANRTHLAFFQAAEKYVTTDQAGNPVFRADAPAGLEKLRAGLENVSLERQTILRGLDKLTDEVAQGRILKEQLHYADATMTPKDDWIAERLQANPIRQKLEAIWIKQNPAEAPHGLAIQDANARRWYEEKLTQLDDEIARVTDALDRHPTGPLNTRHRRDLEQLVKARDHLDPASFYNEIHTVADTLPSNIVNRLSENYGTFGEDWKFSIYDSEDEVKAASRRIADEVVASGMPLPPEWDTPEKIHEGIHEVFKLARDGESGKDWYPQAAQGIMKVAEATGESPKTVAQLFAIYSQAADTIANATFVFRAIREYQKYGDLFVGRFPTRQSVEALSVLKGGTWEGRKRSSFYANILRHIPGMEDEYAQVIKEMADARGAPITHPVTVDRWVVRMFRPGTEKDTPEKFYDTFESIIQKMADHVGWEPEQVQAAAWVSVKQRGFEEEIAKAGGKVKGTLTARLTAGSEDAFQYGIRKNLEKMGEPQKGLEVTPQMNRLANQANRKWGGFTVGHDLKPVPEEGYSVSYSLTERAFKLHGLKGDDIARFRDDYEGLLKDPRNKIGGFSDDINDAGDATEQTLLSITRHFKRRADALKFAREQGQETVYEYKTGDGIRTGLTRAEQGDIIRNLDQAHLKGGPVTDLMPLEPEAQAYRDFLDKAAREFGYAKDGKPVSPAQRSRAEEWLSQKSDQFPDEPIVQEWYDHAGRTRSELPDWMVEPSPPEAAAIRDGSSGQLHMALFNEAGEPSLAAEGILRGRGEVAAKGLPGYDDAVAALARQEIPNDFIEAVVNSPLHIYDKTAIGRHLDSLAGGTLKGRDFPGIPGAAEIFPEVLQLAGLWEGVTRSLYFSAKAHPIDWIHEFTHAMETADAFPPKAKAAIWKHVGADVGDKLSHDQSEDVADMISAVVLGFDPAKSSLPDSVKTALSSIQKAMKASEREFKREHVALAKLPEEERIFLEDIFTFQEEEGMHFTNGFKPKPGQYVPEQLGLPFRFGNPLAPRRAATHWLRLLGGKRVVSLTPTDAHLTHEFKGELLRSGRWGKSVIDGPLEGLMKAYNLQRMADVHAIMVQAGRAVPASESDVMIPLDPKGWTDKTRAQARDMIEILNSMDNGATVDKLALDKVDAQAIEAVKDFMFPGLTDSSAAKIAEIARQAMAKPIDGVVWVDRNLLLKTNLFHPSSAKTPLVKYGVAVTDDINNIMKMMTLSLNPAYYPMNMAGQAIMLGSQLSFSAPFSLARGLAQARRLSEEDVALIDRFADIGYAGSFMSKGGALKRTTDTVGKVGTLLIDKYPRRLSFLHEARRLGYKTDAQVHALVNDIDKFDDLVKVHERVQRAMVDYGNLNRFEKEYLTRLVFVYPWLRGSSRYAAQFPFDHPVQAALFAGLVYWQQNRLRQAFPEGHPGYMKWFMPLDIPKDGENPYGFRMDQLATPLQTLDLAAMMTYWGSGGKAALPWGSNEEGIGSMFGPLAEEIEKTITGYDSFTRQTVSHGIPQLFARILDPRERWASWQRLTKILDHQTHTGLYDTNQTQNWLRLFLGSLAPMDVDAGKAGDMSQPVGTQSASQSRDAYVAKVEAANGAPLTEAERTQIAAWKTNDQAYRKVSRQYRDDHEIEGDSTIQERAAMLLLTVAEINPKVADEAKRRADMALNASDEDAQAAYDELRQALGLTQLSTLDGRMRKQQMEQRTTP